MVLEYLFDVQAIREKKRNLFVLGFIFTEVGILASMLVFPSHAGLMSIAFTSILVTPLLRSAMKREMHDSVIDLPVPSIFIKHSKIFATYTLLFLGILVSYATFTTLLPEFAVFKLFSGLLSAADISGAATQNLGAFSDYLTNNLIVLAACFLFSLIFDVGSMLFLTWNASVWGSVIGFLANKASAYGGTPIYNFAVLFAKIFPHMIAEASAYFLAIIGGIIISQAFEHFNKDPKKFNESTKQGLIFTGLSIVVLIIAAYLEAYFFPIINAILA